ncbi:alpha-hydroxy acid oxidase [Ferrimicrobium acidiphilum]|uniref:Alpha-hydroxy-acid oxidizing protein n=1 Tax=Ferrimicrobium acidiphilum TaxID=121039 RepID=A0ABV3Y324_9ACTN
MTKPWLARDLLGDATRELDPAVGEYFFGAADRELLMRRNYRAWQRYAITPAYLRRPANVACSTEFRGRSFSCPLIVAPVAFQSLLDPTGEPGLAFAAGVAGVGYTVSTRSSRRLTAVAEAFALGQSIEPEDVIDLDQRHRALLERWRHQRRAELWLQLYQTRNHDFVEQLVETAAKVGVRAAALTIDTPHLGARYHDQTNVFSPLDRLRRVLEPADQDGPAFGDGFSGTEIDQEPNLDLDQFVRDCEAHGLDPIVKGILSTGDLAAMHETHIDAGPIVPWVSNHGGRQSDLVPSTAEALARLSALGHHDEFVVDGGIAAPSDALVAIALGASVVAIGRPVMAAFAIGGVRGAMEYLLEFRSQLHSQLTILGYDSPRALVSNAVREYSSGLDDV